MQTVTIKLTPTEVELLDNLVMFKHYKSRSDCIRKALDALAGPLTPTATKKLNQERRNRRRRTIRYTHT